MSELPEGWITAGLLDVVDLHDSRRIPLNQSQREQKKGPYPYYGANGQVDSIDDYIFEGDYVLLAEDGGYFDQPERGVAYEASGKFWVNNHAHILSTVLNIPRRYLTYALNSIDWMRYVGGSTRLKLTQDGMRRVQLPVPPLAEQRRIVAKLDTLTGATARARAELDRIPALIARYKQAILSAAFTGDLTREWRDPFAAETRHSASHAVSTDSFQELDVLPKLWSWSSMGTVSSITGVLTKNAKRTLLPRTVPYLRVANVYTNELRLDDIAEIGCTEAEAKKTRLQLGDLLIVEGNGSLEQIGRVALWRGAIPECSHQNHIIRARPSSSLIPLYGLYWLMSPQGRLLIQRVASSSSGLYTLSISRIAALPIPICPVREQQEIVRRIETAFGWLDRLAAEHGKAARLLPRLDQEIFAKAFRGELVPQDPSDEPASALLERIRTERAADPGAPRRRTGRKAHGTVQEISHARKGKGRAVTKTRKEVSATYLSDLLQKLGGSAQAQELWRQSDMSIDEFYKLLREEVKAGRIAEGKDKERLVIRHAA